jgi:hypothetical protein
MSKNAIKPEKNRDHVVIALRRRGLDKTVTVHGPFTKAHAYTFASHHQQYQGDECCVELLHEPCQHNKWIFEGV